MLSNVKTKKLIKIAVTFILAMAMISGNTGIVSAETGQLVWKHVPVNEKTISQNVSDKEVEEVFIIGGADDVPYVAYVIDTEPESNYKNIYVAKLEGKAWQPLKNQGNDKVEAAVDREGDNLSVYVYNDIPYVVSRSSASVRKYNKDKSWWEWAFDSTTVIPNLLLDSKIYSKSDDDTIYVAFAAKYKDDDGNEGESCWVRKSNPGTDQKWGTVGVDDPFNPRIIPDLHGNNINSTALYVHNNDVYLAYDDSAGNIIVKKCENHGTS